ncbi:DUF1439 domain-containing protein [Testudinibacter sp. P27/CKL/0425]
MLQTSVIKSRLGGLIALLLFLFPFSLHASNFEISEAQINHYLTEKLGYSDEFSLPGILKIDYQIDQIKAKVGQNQSNKIELDSVVSAGFFYGNKHFNSELNLVFDVEPEYDPQQGSVYLKNLRMLRWSSEPQQYADQLQIIMPMLNGTLQTLLNQFPVYTLDSNDQTQNLIKSMVKKLSIKPGKVVLETLPTVL